MNVIGDDYRGYMLGLSKNRETEELSNHIRWTFLEEDIFRQFRRFYLVILVRC